MRDLEGPEQRYEQLDGERRAVVQPPLPIVPALHSGNIVTRPQLCDVGDPGFLTPTEFPVLSC